MAETHVQPATVWLREEMDKFIAEFEEEYEAQKNKTNLSSERRMRKILRDFRKRIYEPYRDMTSNREPEPTVDGTPVPF